MNLKYKSSKIYNTYSSCFRQWKATSTHCAKLHGYGVSFKITFEGELDEKNWVLDYGIAKRSKIEIEGKTLKDYLDWLLDHTVIIAEDDPEIEWFKEGEKRGIIQLRILPNVGCERFAEFLFIKISEWVSDETKGRVKVHKIEVFENDRNSSEVSE